MEFPEGHMLVRVITTSSLAGPLSIDVMRVIKPGENDETAEQKCAAALDRMLCNLNETDTANHKSHKNLYNGKHLKLLFQLSQNQSNCCARALNAPGSLMPAAVLLGKELQCRSSSDDISTQYRNFRFWNEFACRIESPTKVS
jgi:hypothetical protein